MFTIRDIWNTGNVVEENAFLEDKRNTGLVCFINFQLPCVLRSFLNFIRPFVSIDEYSYRKKKMTNKWIWERKLNYYPFYINENHE